MLQRLQYISQGERLEDQWVNISEALDGGCRWIQLRFKNAPLGELLELGTLVREKCTVYDAVFIVNDHAAVAEAVEADGVHLGLGDMPVARARAILGPGKIVGGTANTLEDVYRRVAERCDYVGLGPFRFTSTKKNLSPILGLEGYQAIIAGLKDAGLSIPLYAIGGIRITDIPGILKTGVYGVAVSGLLTEHPDKSILVGQFNRICETYAHTTVNDSR